MIIDCESCPVRGVRCPDCSVAAVFASVPVAVAEATLPLDAAERRAVAVLTAGGLVAPAEAAAAVARPEPWRAYPAVG